MNTDITPWLELAQRELKGKDPDTLNRVSAEGITVKPLYTAADLDQLANVNSLPGLFPYLRGPYATMYTQKPWTIRQYAGFSTAEESNGEKF